MTNVCNKKAAISWDQTRRELSMFLKTEFKVEGIDLLQKSAKNVYLVKNMRNIWYFPLIMSKKLEIDAPYCQTDI